MMISAIRPTARVLSLALGIALLASSPNADVNAATQLANSSAGTPQNLSPTERERLVSKLVSSVIERTHYRQTPINDQVSTLVLERYLESLDNQRSFFLASDIAEFERYRYQLDDAILRGEPEPAFVIFNRLQTRSRERWNYALEALKTEPNFQIEESFEFEREKAPWAKTTAELNDLWRKRVKNDALSLALTDKPWSEARDILRKRYERVLKRTEQTTADDIFEIFMNAFAHVFDPHSNYFSPRNTEEYKIQMSLSYEGIGASLQLTDDYVTVINVLPGGPADISDQLKINDRITAVGEGKAGKLTDVIGWRIDDVVQLIRGKINTVVRLQILPAGVAPGSPEKLLEFTRNKVIMEAQAAKKEIRKVERGERNLSVGVINVPSFYQDFEGRAAGDQEYRSTTRDVRRLINELKAEGVGSLILDLRGNGGGHLNEATGLTGLFIPGGPIVQLRETGGRIEVLDDPEPNNVAWDGPLVVLVDRFSASASEIFAGAIQDYGRGIIIGQATYGKGTVQSLYPLDRYAVGSDNTFGQLTVTIGKYYRVTGESTQHRGVVPDILLPSAINNQEVGESSRESALPWDRIHAVPFGKEAALKQAVGSLTQSHQSRVATDPDFQLLLKDIGIYETVRAQKSVSLNLKHRQVERTLLEQQRLDNENLRRKALNLPALKAISELTPSEQRDAILIEASQIAVDLQTWKIQTLAKLRTAS
ncbi:MAG: carboxy terminal-processing peptidase [Candidatus Obscuribacterales bacterium]|nr:carboxy terminal-processing peptidase [Steroidobacteraceae bacterium]